MPKLDNVYPTSTASSYAVYGNKHAQVVLHALDDPFSLDMLDFTADRCFIFAETVSISTDLKISSPKQLTICCSNIKVVGDKQIAVYLVGDGGKTADTGGARGDDGGAGGCLSLYVENNVLSLSGKLRFVTDGGSGGSGGDIYEGYHNTGMGGNPWWNFGGQGGKGGPAGMCDLDHSRPIVPSPPDTLHLLILTKLVRPLTPTFRIKDPITLR